MKLNKKIFDNLKKKEINFIIVDGITCSGKSLFANLLKKNLKNKFSDILILSKDLFLYPREKRIKITRSIRKIKKNQNQLHYNLSKLKLLLNFLNGNNKEKTLVLKNLYNRKTGKNNLKMKFHFLKKRLIIFEGIYVSDDIKSTIKPILKILIIEKVYESLARKIERIRDKKISVQLVVTEFIKIHLESFKRYLAKNNFDIAFEDKERNFVMKKNGKIKQLDYIKKFLSKHRY
jgi:uridine kinase